MKAVMEVTGRYVADLSARIAAFTRVEAASWFGCLTGLAGSAVLSLERPFSGYGWVLYLASNGAMIYWAAKKGSWAVIIMQLGFTLTSLNGLRNWLHIVFA